MSELAFARGFDGCNELSRFSHIYLVQFIDQMEILNAFQPSGPLDFCLSVP